jgi:uncharacterized iron-regulated protein
VTSSRRRGYGHPAPPARRRSRLRIVVLSALAVVASIGLSKGQAADSLAAAASACAVPGGWVDVKTGRSLARGELFGDLAEKGRVVLLGESHTDLDDHLWELHTLAALHGRGGSMVIGFEAFPRRLQSVLDEWVEGKLTDEAFLKASEWRQVWGYDPALYMPLFQFARLNRIPMVPLNVEHTLVAKVGKEGWQAVPVSEREGLSDPAPASAGYQRDLARVYLMKKSLPPGTDPLSVPQDARLPEPDDAALADTLAQPEFKHFVEAQLTWDRAMAEALAGARHKFADATIVGILGSGHVEDGNGVPHQLKDLGIEEVSSLIPVAVDEACKLVGTAYADAIFTLPQSEAAPPSDRPRLGVVLVPGDGAPSINRVVNDSVAATAGLKAGDLVVRAAGLEMRNPDDLVDTIAQQAPGTWLPLSIKRDGQEVDLIAKFPPRPRTDR